MRGPAIAVLPVPPVLLVLLVIPVIPPSVRYEKSWLDCTLGKLLPGTSLRTLTLVSGMVCRGRPVSDNLPALLPSLVPIVTITRRLRFNAAHRIHNPALSDEENARTFGKCNNPNGHGHNYTLDVSVTGPIDERTGYVMDLGRVKQVVTREVIDKLDHRNLNVDVDFLRGINPTSENLVVACWKVIEPHVQPARLTRLRLWETEHNYVDYDGRDAS